MNKMRIVFYKSTRIPVRDFIDTMGKQDQAKVLACLKSIEDLGFDSPRVQFRQIRGKLWEIKIHALVVDIGSFTLVCIVVFGIATRL